MKFVGDSTCASQISGFIFQVEMLCCFSICNFDDYVTESSGNSDAFRPNHIGNEKGLIFLKSVQCRNSESLTARIKVFENKTFVRKLNASDHVKVILFVMQKEASSKRND